MNGLAGVNGPASAVAGDARIRQAGNISIASCQIDSLREAVERINQQTIVLNDLCDQFGVNPRPPSPEQPKVPTDNTVNGWFHELMDATSRLQQAVQRLHA